MVIIGAAAALVLRPWAARTPATVAVGAAPLDAGPVDAAPLDAAPDAPLDAGEVDAAAKSLDARAPVAPTVDARPAAATGTLRVGANPWGDVFVDGKRLGRAPNRWTIAVGPHQLEVVFPADDGERRRRFEVTVTAADEAVVFADFLGP